MRKVAVIFLLFIAVFWAPFAQGQSREVALALYNENQFEEAANLLESIYRNQPSDENYALLLNCYNQLKKYEPAEKLVIKHLKRVKRTELWVDLGYFQLRQKKEKEATKSFETALAAINRNPGLAYAISEQFSGYGLFAQALSAYQLAEKQNPGLRFHFQKGMLYAELGDVENMIAEYLAMIDDSPANYSNVRARLARNISPDPENEVNVALRKELIKRIQQTQNPLYSDFLIWLYIEESAYDKALRQLMALDGRGQNSENAIYQLGLKAQQEQQLNVALNSFDYLQKKGPNAANYADAVFQKLNTQRIMLVQNPESAQADYVALIQAHKQAVDQLALSERVVYALRNMADMYYFNLSEADSAIQILLRTIDTYNRSYANAAASCKVLLGDILLAQNKPLDAIFKYMEVERSFSASPLGDEAKFKKGMVAYYTFDFAWALTQFEALKASTTKLISNDALKIALLITDNSADDTLYQGLSYYARADFYFFKNQSDSALATLALLQDVFPQHAILAEARLLEANILVQLAKYNDAIAVLENMLALGGDIWADDALMLLGNLYAEKIGNTEKAMQAYEEVLFEHPGSTFVPEARRQYRKLRGDSAVN